MSCRTKVNNTPLSDLRRIWNRVNANMLLDEDIKEAMASMGYSDDLHGQFNSIVNEGSGMSSLAKILSPIREFYEGCSHAAQLELDKLETKRSSVTPISFKFENEALVEQEHELAQDYIAESAYKRGYDDVVSSIEFILADPALKIQ